MKRLIRTMGALPEWIVSFRKKKNWATSESRSFFQRRCKERCWAGCRVSCKWGYLSSIIIALPCCHPLGVFHLLSSIVYLMKCFFFFYYYSLLLSLKQRWGVIKLFFSSDTIPLYIFKCFCVGQKVASFVILTDLSGMACVMCIIISLWSIPFFFWLYLIGVPHHAHFTASTLASC